jgi:uncharacterized protein
MWTVVVTRAERKCKDRARGVDPGADRLRRPAATLHADAAADPDADLSAHPLSQPGASRHARRGERRTAMAARAIKTLEGEPYISLETLRRSGRGVETPVWFAILEGKLYVVTDGTSAKVKRLRATKKVRIAPCNLRGTVTGEWIAGAGRIVKDDALIERAHASLVEKYGWQMWILDTTSWLFGRIDRRAYLELTLA